MTLEEFRSLVSANATWFAGVNPVNVDSLAAAERRLGVSLPDSLKWLLSEYGYSSVCGVSNLGESIETTIRCRQSFAIPSQYVILDDKGDAGVVVLDTGSSAGRVIWVGAHEVPKLATDASRVEDCDEFNDFPSWVLRCLREAKEEMDD